MNQKGFANIALVIAVIILAGAIGYSMLSKEPQVPEIQSKASPVLDIDKKIDDRILKLVREQNSNRVVGVIILLIEDQKIQTLPEDPVKREQTIEQLGQARKISQAPLIKRLQPHGVTVIEQYWLTNSFLAKVPLKAIEIVADQPEVISISPRYGGEPPPN